MKTLFSVMETFDAESVCQDVWDLLVMVPTNQATRASIAAVADLLLDAQATDSIVDWAQVLDAGCVHKTVYCLQIVDALITPSSDNLEQTQLAPHWHRAFLILHGFSYVLDLFRSSKLPHQAVAVGLRIIKCCAATVAFDTSGEPAYETAQYFSTEVKDSLVPRLIQVILDQHASNGAHSKEVISDSLAILSSVAHMQPGVSLFENVPLADKLASDILITNPHAPIRDQVAKMLQNVVLLSPSDGCGRVLRMLMQAVELVDCSNDTCSELFGLLNVLVTKQAELEKEQHEGFLQTIADLVWKKLTFLQQGHISGKTTTVLLESLKLLQVLVRLQPVVSF